MESIKKSFCHLCLAECGIKITVEDNKFAKISPDFDDPISQGYVCEKSQKLIGFQHNTDRITSPLKKIDGTFVPISWEQAIDEISIRLKPFTGTSRGRAQHKLDQRKKRGTTQGSKPSPKSNLWRQRAKPWRRTSTRRPK